MPVSEIALPRVDRFVFDDYPKGSGRELDFRLVYRGPLPSQSGKDTRAAEKHRIRKEFHKQLSEFWKTDPFLVQLTKPYRDQPLSYVESVSTEYARCGHNFVPLVRRENGTACALDILFLRRDAPGNLIEHGGDIDNRIKTLFDALRIPEVSSGVTLPEPHETPFFCLLEDDALITDVSVTTDRLLSAQEPLERIHDVVLVIHVRLKVVDVNLTLGTIWQFAFM